MPSMLSRPRCVKSKITFYTISDYELKNSAKQVSGAWCTTWLPQHSLRSRSKQLHPRTCMRCDDTPSPMYQWYINWMVVGVMTWMNNSIQQKFIPCICLSMAYSPISYTARCRYNVVKFLLNHQNRIPYSSHVRARYGVSFGSLKSGSDAVIERLYVIQWNLSITTTQRDTYLPSGAHLGGQGPPRWAPEGRHC